MRIALIADAYPPLRTSGAVQVRDLAQELASQGHEVTVLVPCAARGAPWAIHQVGRVQVLSIGALTTKDVGYVRRTIAEALLPFRMLRGLRSSPLGSVQWQAAIWYSPSIFLGLLVGALKRTSRCRSYLILRDIFPEWAVDMGLLRRGFAYRFFKLVERYQYSVADVIGVQSPSNLGYLADWAKGPGRRLEVLHNWLAPAADAGCSISVGKTSLACRTILVYAGNMGVAQGMDILLDLADGMKNRRDVGFLFVGRGSDVPRLRALAESRALDNVIFCDEIEPAEIPGLLRQCHIGLVALDPRHRTHNVPGKFLAYMQAGLPVLARVNAGNDLIALIESEQVGCAYVGDSPGSLELLARRLCDDADLRRAMSSNAARLATSAFSVSAVARQITEAMSES
ncbi:MAG: glycosyltransferase family 4 protein [Steroidobacterales bacterium]